jgi:hypothetical protein
MIKILNVVMIACCFIYYIYKYALELYKSRKKLLLSNFDITQKVPDDINLSRNVKSDIIIDSKKIIDTTNLSEIEYVTKAYLDLNKNLTSNFIVDVFTDKKNHLHQFSVTKLVTKNNRYNAIYLSGNNDYFYHADMAYKLRAKGYNFYAISFPNSGFTSNVNNANFSTFDNMEYLFQYIEIILEFYQIKKIDILFGHSTGGLIATMYADYKNSKSIFIDRLILSSPLLDWYSDPNSKSIIYKEEFLEYIITFIGLIIPKINIKPIIGTPNYTSCVEFNEINFNPKYKSLVEIHTYTDWIRACTLGQRKIQNNKVDVKCKVDIFLSDKSVYWKYTINEDNVLDVEDIKKYGVNISNKVNFHIIKDSIHSCFLRININDYI